MKSLKVSKWLFTPVSYLLLTCNGFFFSPIVAQTYSKNISETFEIAEGGKVSIMNKYGNISIVSSKRSDAVIDVEIEVKTKKESDADKILDAIDVEFSSKSDFVQASTQIKEGKQWKSKKTSFKINYTVSIPIGCALEISNSHGDLAMTSMNNDVELELKHGNASLQNIQGDFEAHLDYVSSFSTGRIDGHTDIHASYSNVTLSDIRSGNVESRFSVLTIGNAEEADVESTNDNYTIGNINELLSRGKYDHFIIGNAASVDVQSTYSNYTVGNLERKADFETDFGAVVINSVSSSFDEIAVRSKHTGYELGIDGSLDLDLEVEHTSLDLPKSMKKTWEEISGRETKIRGTIGNKNQGKLTADMKFGYLKIKN